MQTWLLRGRKLKHNSTSCTTHLPVLRQGCPMTADQWLRLWSEHLSVFQILKWFQSTISNLKTITCVKESQLLPVKFIGRFDLWARGHFLFVFFFFHHRDKGSPCYQAKDPRVYQEELWTHVSLQICTYQHGFGAFFRFFPVIHPLGSTKMTHRKIFRRAFFACVCAGKQRRLVCW